MTGRSGNRRFMRGGVEGFTLIELMFAVTILAIAFSLAAPSISLGMQNAQLRTAAESIQDGLQFARTEALRRNRLVAFTVREDAGWTVTANPRDMGGDGSVGQVLQQRPGPQGASATVRATVRGSATAAFDGLGRVGNADPLTAVDITSSVDGSRILRVELSFSGEVRLCDPGVSESTDPRKCLYATTSPTP